jgi:hypothetical protein
LKKHRPEWGFFETAVPISTSAARTDGTLGHPKHASDFKISHHYLAGLPPNAFAGVTTVET